MFFVDGVCWRILSTARPELPYPCVYKDIIHFKSIICTMQLQTLQYEIRIKVACIIIKSPLVGEHAFPLTEIVGWMSYATIIFMNRIM